MLKTCDSCVEKLLIPWVLLVIASSLALMPTSVYAEQGNPTINYCVDPDWLPYEAIVKGEHVGLSSDYVKKIEELSEYTFKLIPTKTWQETIEKLQSGECEATPFLNQSESRLEYLAFTDIFFESPNLIVASKSEAFFHDFSQVGDRSLAIPKDYRLVEYIQSKYPEVNLVLVKNESEGLNQVSSGKVDLFVGSMLSINRRIFEQGLKNIRIVGWAGPQDKLRMGLILDRAEVIPILNEAIKKIKDVDHRLFLSRWNNTKIIEKTNYELVWKTIVFSIVMLSIVFWRYRVTKKFNHKLKVKNVELTRLKFELESTNKKLRFLSDHDPLTKLYNRNFVNSRIFTDLRANEAESVCLIVVDIDFFKKINDEFGHSTGDKILKSFSDVLTATVRDKDIVARWGGEEFVILCHQSRRADAIRLCERIMEELEKYPFPKVEKITASFGIAKVRDDESIMQCFDRADEALYKAKEKGRDQVCCV